MDTQVLLNIYFILFSSLEPGQSRNWIVYPQESVVVVAGPEPLVDPECVLDIGQASL